MRIKCCPSCGSMAIGFGQVLRPLSRRPVSSGLLPHRWFLICHDCHYRGPTRLFLRRAERAWNKWNGVILQ